MMRSKFAAAVAMTCAIASQTAVSQTSPLTSAPAVSPITPDSARPTVILPAGTPIVVVTNQDLSTATNAVGDIFAVTVVADVMANGTVIIPSGTTGHGEVTFVTRKGGFGKPGIIGISLRTLDLGDKTYRLDGRYREQGKDNDAAAGATMFAVGIFAGFVNGKTSVIPKGRTLKAHIGEDIPLTAAVTPPPPAPAIAPSSAAAPPGPAAAPVNVPAAGKSTATAPAQR